MYGNRSYKSGIGMGTLFPQQALLRRLATHLKDEDVAPKKKVKPKQEYYDPNYEPRFEGTYLTKEPLTQAEKDYLENDDAFIDARFEYGMKMMYCRRQDPKADTMESLGTLKSRAIEARIRALNVMHGRFLTLT